MTKYSTQRARVVDPVTAYDAFAPYYKSYEDRRTPYLQKVEDIVIAHMNRARFFLDVGSGDGSRALRIAKAVRAQRVVLVEPSAGMRALCSEDAEIWKCRASEIPDQGPTFDVITCLWNVLGHIQGHHERSSVLARLRALLRPSGSIFLDVHHRYNASAYGWPRTCYRMLHDSLFKSDTNGDVIVSWRAADLPILTYGHLFTQSELFCLFQEAGLRIKTAWVVNYENGSECRHRFHGHLLYRLGA